jgi:hypothetical protein
LEQFSQRIPSARLWKLQQLLPTDGPDVNEFCQQKPCEGQLYNFGRNFASPANTTLTFGGYDYLLLHHVATAAQRLAMKLHNMWADDFMLAFTGTHLFSLDQPSSAWHKEESAHSDSDSDEGSKDASANSQ